MVQEAEASGRRESGGAQPSWSEGLLSAGRGSKGDGLGEGSWVPQLKREAQPAAAAAAPDLELADRPSAFLDFLSEVRMP